MIGWIKLHRKLNDWRWKKKPEMVALYVDILISANHEDKQWEDITIKRGQFVTSLPNLAQNTGLSVKQVRTCLERLKSTGEVADQSNNKYRLITVLNYESYQEDDRQKGSQEAGKGQAEGRQRAATKETKEIKNNDDDCTRANSELIKKIYSWLEDHFNNPTPLSPAPIHAWLSWGADFELDVKPAAIAQKESGRMPRSLSWLNDRIAASIQQRKAPMPEAKAQSSHRKTNGKAIDDSDFYKQFGISEEVRQHGEPTNH